MTLSQKTRTDILVVGLVVGFILIFSCPSLLRPNVFFVPMLVKTALVCSLSFIFNYRVLLPKFLFRGKYVAYLVSVMLFMTVMLLLMTGTACMERVQ